MYCLVPRSDRLPPEITSEAGNLTNRTQNFGITKKIRHKISQLVIRLRTGQLLHVLLELDARELACQIHVGRQQGFREFYP